jgi:ribosomal protein L11 methyltransferase
MYLWRRRASQKWWSNNEERLRAGAEDRLAIIDEVGRKRLQLQVASPTRAEMQRLVKEFGGSVLKLPSNWLKRFAREQQKRTLKVGKRLIIMNVGGTSVSRVRAGRADSRRGGPSHIVIPAGAAFGTGEHATTAMSLRMVERLTRKWKPGWSIVDLGTGSGILILAAKRLGARRAIGIDNDPTAISTAKENARLNKISNVQFRIGDVHRWKSRAKVDIIIANLFSELLIEILPKLKAARWMIFSGILRNQERDVTRALRRLKIDIVQVRRHGKWVAILTAVG